MSNPGNLIEPSINLHRELLGRLEEDRKAIDEKIAQIQEIIQRLESEARKAAREANGKPTRRPRGENAKLVAELFAAPGTAITMKEIASKTGLSVSSVQRVLQDGFGYSQGEDGLWKRNGQ